MQSINNMFFQFRYVRPLGGAFTLNQASDITSDKEGYVLQYAQKTVVDLAKGTQKMQITLNHCYNDKVKNLMGDAFVDHAESYALHISDRNIDLYSSTERGLIYAVSTLRQLIEGNALSEMLIFDYPDKGVRGYRVYTPGEHNIDKFKDMVDMLLYYKYNSLIIEVGGAMEYKKHPAINEKWVEFCTEVNKSPFEADRIQKETFPWEKNSIHTDNGDGSYITQEQMRDIVDYCKFRQIEVIPEVPSLSHSDYIVMAYPELNERIEDTYPDTYCPSNPKSYEVLFDIIDEVVEVFNPRYMNIGHDECYTLGKCPLCKSKDPVDLYAGDITTINNYLKTKGISAIMWGEKVYGNVYIEVDGVKLPFGGTGNPARDVPRLAECAGKIPTDVTLLQWYWSICSKDDEQNICNMGYNMIYGNYQPYLLSDYRKRTDHVDGGFVSNWGSPQEEYMQRNGQNYSLLTTAWILWSGDYDGNMRGELHKMVKTQLYQRHLSSLGSDIIEIEHTTDYNAPYKAFWCGYYIVPEDWLIGNHLVTYTDGTTAKLPVIYGYNIRESQSSGVGSKDVDSTEAVASSEIEAMGASYSVIKNDKTYYRTAYKNPFPHKQIKNITYISQKDIAVEADYDI